MTKKQLEKYNIDNFTNLLKDTTLSIKLLEENGFDIFNDQVGMVLDINSKKNIDKECLTTRFIGSKEDIDTWIKIVAEYFDYPIINEVIYKISNNKDIDLLLVYEDNIPVGRALIFTNSNVVGVYFLNTSSSINSIEITENIVYEIVEFAKREKIDYLTLLSSVSDLNIYKNLGFEEQFTLKNYMAKCDK
jgi:hypothetical protein